MMFHSFEDLIKRGLGLGRVPTVVERLLRHAGIYVLLSLLVVGYVWIHPDVYVWTYLVE